MPSISEMASNVFIMDNGGYSIKAGFATDSEPRIIPNSVTKAKSERRRQFIGNQIEEIKDASGLYYSYPMTRGYITDWEVQKVVWDYLFGNDMFNVDFKETCMIVTEPYFNFLSTQGIITEIMFEEYKFHSLLRTHSPTLSAYKNKRMNPSEMCCLVIDSGFSFTHIVPHIKGKRLLRQLRRIDMGGKALTNLLKEAVSYRQLNVMDETYVINQVKEDVCFVSTDLDKDLKAAQSRGKDNSIVRDYVLPDYTVIRRGYVRPPEETNGKPKDNEQLIRLNNERFLIPEVLFHPNDAKVNEMGIIECLGHCVQMCPEEVQPHMFKNILLTGGNALFPGYRDRIYNDVRAEANSLLDVKVTLADNPITDAWEGGSLLSNDPEFAKLIVTRKQYEEQGFNYCQEKFDMSWY